jgi:uncharacterized membrane protein (DUF106 family)
MNNGKTIGMLLFFGGIILLISYAILQGISELLSALDLISGFLLGIILVGLITLIISIILEQRHDSKETMQKIKKEDLKP